MADRDFDMSGILFRETDKKTDKSPDYTGKLTMGGTEYRLAGWVREGQRGKFLSLKVSLPGDERRPRAGRPDDDETIPF